MGTSETGSDCAGTKAKRSGVLRLIRRFAANRRGATMVEFSLLALPFFILLWGVFDVGLVIWGGLELDNATADAARMVRTGQAQGESYNEEMMKDEICEHVSLLFDCKNRLRIDVHTFADFASMTAPDPIDNGTGKLKDDFTYEMGEGQSVVLMTTYYEWPLLNMISSMSLSNMPDGNNYLLTASAAFRNEPFQDN